MDSQEEQVTGDWFTKSVLTQFKSPDEENNKSKNGNPEK